MELFWNNPNIKYSNDPIHEGTGRNPIFSSANDLWEGFKEYANYTYQTPLNERVFVGKNAEERDKPHIRPLSWIGFAAYHGCDEKFYSYNIKRMKELGEKGNEFSNALKRINTIMRMQRSEGVSCGFYHPRTAADVNFKDEQEPEQEGFTMDLKVVSFVRTKDDPTQITSSDSEF